MKKLYLVLALCFILCFSAQVSAFDWNDGNIKAYWTFDETTGTTFSDVLGNHDGTIYGSDYQWTPAIINNGLNKSVAGTKFIVPESSELKLNTFTYNFWLNPSTVSGNQWIFSQRILNSGYGGVLFFRVGNQLKFLAGEDSSSWKFELTSNVTLSAGSEYMITGIYDGTNANLYLNGVHVATAAASGNVYYQNIGSTWMADENGSSGDQLGWIDEAMIREGAINTTQIAELYNSGSGLANEIIVNGIVKLESPTNGTTISDVGTNFTVIGTNVSSFAANWTNVTFNIWNQTGSIFNSTTVDFTDNITFNQTLFIDDFTFSRYYWNAEACYTNITGSYCVDAANNNTLDVSLFTIVNETYVNETVAGTLENFSISIDLLEGYDLMSAIFVYNGSYEIPTITAESENRYLLVSDYQIPIILADENTTFYWTLTFTNSTILNSTERTQLVRAILLDNCSVYTNELFNISLFDEETKTSITGDIELVYTLLNVPNYDEIKTLYYKATNVSTTRVCSGLNVSDETLAYSAEIRYSADNYVSELYHIQRADVSEDGVNLSLFDLNSSKSTQFKITYQDSTFNFVEGAIIQLQRKYISEDTYEVVEAPLTSSEGIAVLHIDLDGVKYKITVVKDGELLDTFDNIVFVCESELTGQCEQKLLGEINPRNEISIDTTLDFSYTIADNGNGTITLTFSVPSGVPSSINFLLTQTDIFGNETLCNKTITSSGGSMQCNYSKTIGDSFIDLYVYKDGTLIDKRSFIIPEESGLDFLGNNFFIVFVLLLSIVGMGISSPEWIVVNGIITFVLAGSLYLINGLTFVVGLGGLLWLLISGAILIFKMSKQEDR